jgi:hypothetical protein
MFMTNVNDNVLLLRKVIERLILTKYPSLHEIENISVRRSSSGMSHVYTVNLRLRGDWDRYTDLVAGELMFRIENEVEHYFTLLGFNKGRSTDIITYVR